VGQAFLPAFAKLIIPWQAGMPDLLQVFGNTLLDLSKGAPMKLKSKVSKHNRSTQQHLIIALALLLAAVFVFELPRAESAPPAEFPSLAEACEPVGRLISGNTVRVGKPGVELSCTPLPGESTVTAFEENSHFLCVTAEVSTEEGKPSFVRRFLLLKPSVLVVDDVIRQPTPGQAVQWQVNCRSAAKLVDGRLSVADSQRELTCQRLWPADEKAASATVSGNVYRLELKPSGDTGEVRLLHVIELREAGQEGGPAQSVLKKNDGCLELSIKTADRSYSLELPTPGTEAGWLEVGQADGETLVPRRPLPSGVLPHGPEGMKLIERWDRHYRKGGPAPWDSGHPAKDLKEAVENESIRPCRTVILGCGSGTNAIYLAGKGFDVTAIDVAPTALALAEKEAKKAGVEVRWVLADVLALPKLEKFDLIFDRGCYHNVRYVDAAGFVESMRQLSRPGTKAFILSLDRDSAPGVREPTMRTDFSGSFDFSWLKNSKINTGKDGKREHASWSTMLLRKKEK